MAHRIEDFFPTSVAPQLYVKNIEAPPADAFKPDPKDIATALDPVRDLLAGKRIVALTGAGLSTDSGLPDYRSPGAPPRNPITLQQFLYEERWRRHYWARNHLGWRGPQNATPNAGHYGLAFLEQFGLLHGLITQNVDRLHTKAGSRVVVDLHGRFDEVLCTNCGDLSTREELDSRLSELNPHWHLDNISKMEVAPDADASVANTEDFVIADCVHCGGILRTNVVFFGGKVSNDDVGRATTLVDDADALLVAGSSLAVGSAMRFVRQAHKAKKPIVIINRGPTRGDSRAALKVHIGTSQALSWLAYEL